MTSKNLGLTIITPVLNAVQFIEQCLNSVIQQMQPGIEHLLIDGGSTDGTDAVIRGYSSRFTHIRWISEPDQGQSDAMNKGIHLASGDVIGFLNADDYYEQDVIERVIEKFLTLPPPSFLVGNCFVRDASGEVLWVNKPAGLTFNRMLYGPVVQPYPQNPSAYFYHRVIHDQVGDYDVDEHQSMDTEMIFRIAQVASIHYVDEHWGNFRLAPGAKTWENFQAGGSFKRYDAILRKYRQRLPFLRRLWTSLLYRLTANRLCLTLLYFIRQPEEFLPRLKKRWETLR